MCGVGVRDICASEDLARRGHSSEGLLGSLLNDVKLFCVNMCIFDFFSLLFRLYSSCITDVGLSFLPLESFEVTVTKEGDEGFFLSLL